MSPRLRDWSAEGATPGRGGRVPTVARLYAEGVRLLARRELTASQLREKLLEAGGRQADVVEVLARLRDEGSLDDRRAARLYARNAFGQRKRARARIVQELGRLGIPDEVAHEVVDEVCDTDVERHRLERAVIHALRGTRREARPAQGRHLFASLVRQGYDPDEIRAALRRAGLETDEES